MAHPDDDLFFINPEVGQALRSGRPVATVYLTAGEASGVNGATRGARGRSQPGHDKSKYAKARQNGIRAAYAEMATGKATHPWRRSVIPTVGGGYAEVDTLQGHPHIRLVWTLLHEAGSITRERPHSLHALWEGRVRTLGSQLTHGGAVTHAFSYTREQLVQTLVGFLERFLPTQVRMQNPTPGRLDRNLKCADHQDHRYGARFVQEALARYAAFGPRPHFTVQTYLGYFNGGLPPALDSATGVSKARTLETYSWSDAPRNSCNDPAGCGDLKAAARPKRRWTHSIHHAGDVGTDWLLADGKDGLWAFAVLDGRIARWHRPGGSRGRGSTRRWRGPAFLTETGIDAGIRPVRLPDGRIAVFGTRTLLGTCPTDYRREVGFTVQQDQDGSFGPWRSLGTPELSDDVGTSDIGAPAVSVSDDGTVAVFLRDSRHQLTSRIRLPDGTWTAWWDLGGAAIHGDPAVATDSAGRTYVLAATPRTVLAWIQDQPGASLRGPLATGLPPTTLPLTVRQDGDSVHVFFREPGSGNIRAARLQADRLARASPHGSRGPRTPSPSAEVGELGGNGGYGPVSVTYAAGGNILLAARSATGDLATAWGTSTPAKHRPGWDRTGIPLAGAPASAPWGTGGLALTMLGLDSRLYWTHATHERARFAPWQPAESPGSSNGSRA
ncbi:PIG-L family deacetylase [Actinomycetota bacterium Odt1-20B]